MAWRGATTVSPFKRIRRARGLTMDQVKVYAGVGIEILRKIDRLEADKLGTIKLRSIMRVAMVLECSPADLVPILNVRYKKTKKSV